jgi:hypothetical protein
MMYAWHFVKQQVGDLFSFVRTRIVSSQSKMAAQALSEVSWTTAAAASGWIIAGGLAYINIRSQFYFPVSEEPDSPQSGDPNGLLVAAC